MPEIEKGYEFDLAIMDFSKAFDKVPHKRLIHKLKYYGIRGYIQGENDYNILQQYLDCLSQWEDDWGMEFNPSKCHTMRISRKRKATYHAYSLRGHILPQVNSATYLGVEISSRLDCMVKSHSKCCYQSK